MKVIDLFTHLLGGFMTFKKHRKDDDQDAPVTRQLNCTIQNPDGSPVPAETLVYTDLCVDDPALDLGIRYGGSIETDGRFVIRFPGCAPVGQGANLTVKIAGATWTGRVVTPSQPAVEMGQEGGDGIIALVRSAQYAPFKAWRVSGQFLELEDGTPHTVIACSDFWLFGHFAQGQDITPVLDERVALGFNEVRVFLSMCGGLGTLDPRPHLDKLPAFCELLAAHGLRAELTVFADTQKWLPSEADQRTLFQQVVSLVRPYAAGVRLEGVNEFDNKSNPAPGIVNETAEGVIWALGSMIQDAGTKEPVKDYGTYHPGRTSDWPRKVGHNAMEDVADKHNIPCVSNECKRPDEDEGRTWNFFDAATNAALLCAGAGFHSNSGKGSTLMTPEDRGCATEWTRGALAVPLKYQRGTYTRGGLHDCPIKHEDDWASRTHCRILGNESCCVVMQRNEKWQLVPVAPWVVVSQTDSVIELRR